MLRAVLLMTIGMMCIPLGDSAGKALTSIGVAPVFIVWTRAALGLVLLLPFLRRRHFDLRVFGYWGVYLRGFLFAGGTVSILTALQREPIADVFGAFFVGPIISYVLSVWLLKERVSIERTALLLVGFFGVLLIVKPGFDGGTGLFFAVLAGVFYGCFLTASRWLGTAIFPRTLLMSQLFIASVVLLPVALPVIPEINWPVTGLLFVSAAASLTGNLLLILAYKQAEATRMAPLIYVQLIGATLYGIVFFGTWPDIWSLIGLSLLVLSGFAALTLRR